MALTFCLGDCVADFGLDVMHTVIRKDQGQAGRGHTWKSWSNISKQEGNFVSQWADLLPLLCFLLLSADAFGKPSFEHKDLFTQARISLSQVTPCTQSCTTRQAKSHNFSSWLGDKSLLPQSRSVSKSCEAFLKWTHKLRTALHHGLALKTLHLYLDFILNLTPLSNLRKWFHAISTNILLTYATVPGLPLFLDWVNSTDETCDIHL